MAVYLPIGTSTRFPVLFAPFSNCAMCFAESLVRANVCGHSNQPGGSSRTNDARGICEWGGDFHAAFERDCAVEIHRDMSAGAGELSGASKGPHLTAEGRYHSRELVLWDTGADHRGDLGRDRHRMNLIRHSSSALLTCIRLYPSTSFRAFRPSPRSPRRLTGRG